MKAALSVLSLLMSLSAFSQYALPQIGTTEQKVLADLAKGISNESWFKKQSTGYETYCIIFRNTPVGIKHAFDKYYELRKEYETDDCTDESLISSTCYKSDNSIDYEMLSITITTESSEIKKRCKIDDTKIKSFRLVSTGGQSGFIMMLLNVLVK